MLSVRSHTPPVDLEIRVQTSSISGRTQLLYGLHSPASVAPFVHREIIGPTFQGSPEELQRRMLQQIEDLGDGLDVGGEVLLEAEIPRKLVSLGRGLWEQLFNEEMRQAYRRFRDVRTLLIFSDEPWIPWEMIKPYDDQGALIDDEFFAERFELTRWLSGNQTLANEIQIRSFVYLASPDSGLPKIDQERELINRLLQEKGVRDVSPRSPDVQALSAVLQQGGIGLIHFAGHGTFDSALANEAGLDFGDGSAFRPSDLHGPLQTQLKQDRPLVFWNACRSGRQGWSLTSLGGWADRWVRGCGCGAFLGSQWNVRNSVALAFAESFYESLARGETLGLAAKTARQAARKTPGPGWLGYAVYGHPNAQVRLTPATQTETPVPETLRRSQFFGDIFSQDTAVVVETPPQSTTQPVRTAMASSNLRIKQKFTDRDRDRFIEESFEYIANFSMDFSNNTPPSRRSSGGLTVTDSPLPSIGKVKRRLPAESGFPGALWATSLMRMGIPGVTTPTTRSWPSKMTATLCSSTRPCTSLAPRIAKH
jgi:hypothetical protein